MTICSPPKKEHPAIYILKKISGILLIIIGVILWLIPIVSGWPFILLGIALLFGREFLEKIKNKYCPFLARQNKK